MMDTSIRVGDPEDPRVVEARIAALTSATRLHSEKGAGLNPEAIMRTSEKFERWLLRTGESAR